MSYHMCRTWPAGGGTRRRGGERRRVALRSRSPRRLAPPGGGGVYCALSPSARGACRVGRECAQSLVKSRRAPRGPRLLLSPDSEPCAVLGSAVPSVPGLGSIWEGGGRDGGGGGGGQTHTHSAFWLGKVLRVTSLWCVSGENKLLCKI